MRENGRNIPFRLSAVACEILLFFLTKELVSGGNDSLKTDLRFAALKFAGGD